MSGKGSDLRAQRVIELAFPKFVELGTARAFPERTYN
jgi:hypothetical protein